MEDSEVSFAMICIPKVILNSIIVTGLTFKILDMLNEYSDNVVDEFPNEFLPMRSISFHIDLILG